MYFSSDCFLESVGNCQLEKFTDGQRLFAQKPKVSPHFGVSVPYFHGRYSEGHFEVRAMSGRGSTKSERYRPTINEKPSETMFQRVLLDFVLKTFGLGAENETRTRDPNLGKVVLYQLSYFRIMFLNRSTFIGFVSAKVVAFFHSPKLFAKKIQKNRIFYVFAHFLSLNRHFLSQTSCGKPPLLA